MSSQVVGGTENISRVVLENQFMASAVQTLSKSGQNEEKTTANLQWDRELDIVIIKVLRGERVMFQIPPDAILEMAKYLRRNFLRGVLVNRTV